MIRRFFCSSCVSAGCASLNSLASTDKRILPEGSRSSGNLLLAFSSARLSRSTLCSRRTEVDKERIGSVVSFVIFSPPHVGIESSCCTRVPIVVLLM